MSSLIGLNGSKAKSEGVRNMMFRLIVHPVHPRVDNTRKTGSRRDREFDMVQN